MCRLDLHTYFGLGLLLVVDAASDSQCLYRICKGLGMMFMYVCTRQVGVLFLELECHARVFREIALEGFEKVVLKPLVFCKLMNLKFVYQSI